MKRLVAILSATLVCAAWTPGGAEADFGLSGFDVALTSVDGSFAHQAGSHPFASTVSLELNANGNEAEGRLKDLFLDLAPGLVAHPNHPRCTTADFGMDDCPLVSMVGTADSSFDEPDQSVTAPVFNLTPPPGTLMRLGFRIAGAENVFLDAGLSPEPPYNLIAEVSDFPETVELFGIELQLWGDPSNAAHDDARGGPVAAAPAAFLTLPRSCEGPLSSFAEVLSWEGAEELGESITDDAVGNPLGFGGCSNLAFQPFAAAQPTTDAAQTTTGLDLSVAFQDEGLLNPGGIAESDVRELALFLPDEMVAGSALGSGAGACSQADLEAEGLEDVPGEGCPEASKAGTVEVESALLADVVEGAVYRAVPFANLAGDSSMALYLVLRDAERGILVKQAVGLETHPEAGYLVAFAEEIPELPFERLQLHLSAAGGTLVSPSRCGEYESAVELVPRSDDLFVVDSSFEIVSGPDGGPCPADGGDVGTGTTGGGQVGPSPASASPPASAPIAAHKRTCSKGKRRVRRNGKVRCVRQKHKKSKADRRRRGGRGR